MKLAKLAILATALAATPIAANASDVAPGVTVYGPEGNPVGTIKSVTDGQTILDTGKHEVTLGLDMYGESEAGPTITVTKTQLDAIMDEGIANRDAALVSGAAVLSAYGKPAGTLGAVDLEADTIILESTAGPIALKREHFQLDGNGALMALFTVEQIAAAAGGASGDSASE